MKICIECQEDVSGRKAVKVKEDRVVRGIRAVKRALKISQENELYVCEKHLEEQKKKRKGFERSMLIFGILAAVVVLLLMAMLLLSGRFDIVFLVYSLLVGGFIVAFAVLFRYAPAVEEGPPALVTPSPRTAAGKKAAAPEKAAGKGGRKSKR